MFETLRGIPSLFGVDFQHVFEKFEGICGESFVLFGGEIIEIAGSVLNQHVVVFLAGENGVSQEQKVEDDSG